MGVSEIQDTEGKLGNDNRTRQTKEHKSEGCVCTTKDGLVACRESQAFVLGLGARLKPSGLRKNLEGAFQTGMQLGGAQFGMAQRQPGRNPRGCVKVGDKTERGRLRYEVGRIGVYQNPEKKKTPGGPAKKAMARRPDEIGRNHVPVTRRQEKRPSIGKGDRPFYGKPNQAKKTRQAQTRQTKKKSSRYRRGHAHNSKIKTHKTGRKRKEREATSPDTREGTEHEKDLRTHSTENFAGKKAIGPGCVGNIGAEGTPRKALTFGPPTKKVAQTRDKRGRLWKVVDVMGGAGTTTATGRKGTKRTRDIPQEA